MNKQATQNEVRLFEHFIGLNQVDFDRLMKFYINYYRKVMSETSKPNFLLKLRELKHDLLLAGVTVSDLNEVCPRVSLIRDPITDRLI